MNSWAKRSQPGQPLDVFYWCHWLVSYALLLGDRPLIAFRASRS
jgi:hypothetical protein